jgi:ribosomal subunit interface protein
MNVEIQTRHVTMEPAWKALIDERLAKLTERFPELLRVHVTLRRDGHHQHGSDEVDVVANVSGTTLRAAKRREDVLAALHVALDALERELANHHSERIGS